MLNKILPTHVDIITAVHLYLKEDPLLKKMALDLGWGWSNRRKNEWCSTQFFQKILHWSRLPIRNSSVSWWGPCGTKGWSFTEKRLNLRTSISDERQQKHMGQILCTPSNRYRQNNKVTLNIFKMLTWGKRWPYPTKLLSLNTLLLHLNLYVPGVHRLISQHCISPKLCILVDVCIDILTESSLIWNWVLVLILRLYSVPFKLRQCVYMFANGHIIILFNNI